jgi:hypothetical protein
MRQNEAARFLSRLLMAIFVAFFQRPRHSFLLIPNRKETLYQQLQRS